MLQRRLHVHCRRPPSTIEAKRRDVATNSCRRTLRPPSEPLFTRLACRRSAPICHQNLPCLALGAPRSNCNSRGTRKMRSTRHIFAKLPNDCGRRVQRSLTQNRNQDHFFAQVANGRKRIAANFSIRYRHGLLATCSLRPNRIHLDPLAYPHGMEGVAVRSGPKSSSGLWGEYEYSHRPPATF